MLDEDLDDSHMGEEGTPLTHDTTVVLEPGDRAEADSDGNLIVTVGAGA